MSLMGLIVSTLYSNDCRETIERQIVKRQTASVESGRARGKGRRQEENLGHDALQTIVSISLATNESKYI